jgi:hypothetical protein
MYHPSGEELFRFYQAYMATKDTLYRHAVTQGLNVGVEVGEAELAVVCQQDSVSGNPGNRDDLEE